MAKKNETPNMPAKSIDEMTDIEFITSADYLASPYYRAYISAKSRLSDEAYQPLSKTYDKPATSAKSAAARDVQPKAAARSGKKIKGAVYSKKRGVAHFFITLFMLVIIAVAVLGFIDLSYGAVYVRPGVTEDTDINFYLLDPVFGVIKKFADVDLDSYYFDSFVSNLSENTEIMVKVALYAVPAAALLILICALIGFFKGIVAMCSKRQANGMYKKFKFGFLSLVMLLSALIMLVGGIFASGQEITVILDFILGKTNALCAGYGLYALVVLPIITFILSCIGYKKAK